MTDSKKYVLCVGALFKNEEHAIQEWMEHYIFHGVEHFYLIDDASTDRSVELLQPYIEKGIVTLFHVDCPYYLGRQRDLYTTHILPHLKETQWLLMVDFDEFAWSPKSISLAEVLQNEMRNLGQIQIRESMFYSNGHEKQPQSIVAGFTKRDVNTPISNDPSRIPALKYFVNSDYAFSALNIHHATFVDKMHEENNFLILYPEYFRYNHYTCQSRDIWNRVKCSRGDSDNYLVRTPESFDGRFLNKEEIEDTGLLEQNRPLLERMGLLS